MFALSVTALFLVVLPLAWLVVLALRSPGSWGGRALSLAGCLLYILLVFVVGGWAVVGWYTRWSLPLVALPLAVLAASRARGVRALPRGSGGWLGAAASLVALAFVGDAFVELGASSALPPTVQVKNPLGAGVYLVLNGGDNAVVNGHHEVLAQRYALDILGLNGAGFNAERPGSSRLEDYAIYGTALHAPCSGEVLVARDGLADLPVGPPGEAGRLNPLGNTVLIHCESDITVVLAHLKPNSVAVTSGQRVSAGDVLGAVGNSGNTSEPHLHLHAVRGRVSDPLRALADAEPVPLSIDGRFLVRNDRLIVSSDGARVGGSS